MREWRETVQRMIGYVETHLCDAPLLPGLSGAVGYSPWYCSVLFRDVTGMTLKAYVSGRRLAKATEEIRDTKRRILDVAVEYGYSSQEALSRAFRQHYGCTPAAYRRHPVPLRMTAVKNVLFPDDIETGDNTMEASKLSVRVEHIPAHRYLGIWEERASDYCSFWQYHDCDTVCGYVTSMDGIAHPIVTPHTAGWQKQNGKIAYFYGSGVDTDYDGPVPEGFSLRDIPAGDYLVFSYPCFDFLAENAEVMPAVEGLARSFDPHTKGYEWDGEARPVYQRHFPEQLGYQVLRPVKRLPK